MQLIRGVARIDLDHIGEGWEGDYDPEDENDQPLLRFDCFRKAEPGFEDCGDETPDGWIALHDGSYCTQVPATATGEQQQAILEVLMGLLEEGIVAGRVKKAGERASWVSLDSLKEGV